MLIVSLDVPGPPLVITKIVSNAFSASMTRITAATTMNGQISGTVMKRNICQPLAPSITAASYGSAGRLDRPPNTISITSGVHCQVSTITRVGITVLLLYTQVDGGRPTEVNK